MVRFSDMLGGSGEPEDGAAADSPYAALANDEDEDEEEGDDEAEIDAGNDPEHAPAPVAEAVPMSTFETPEAVLDRLTRYATAARVAEPVATEPVIAEPGATEPAIAEPAPVEETEPEEEPDSVSAVGDDFLPKMRGVVRRRGRKRHP